MKLVKQTPFPLQLETLQGLLQDPTAVGVSRKLEDMADEGVENELRGIKGYETLVIQMRF